MKRGYIGLALGALVAVGAALSLPSCGHDQKLVSVTGQPTTFTFLTQAGSEQFTATGTYIHPPATKDVTSQATWKVDDGVVNINGGLASPSPKSRLRRRDNLCDRSCGHRGFIEYCDRLCNGDGG